MKPEVSSNVCTSGRRDGLMITTSIKDNDILRSLGERIAKITSEPIMDERRRLWIKQKALHAERPMLLTETSGVIDQVIPLTSLKCENQWLRSVERSLRNRIYYHESIRDDTVIEARVQYAHQISHQGYGVDATIHRTDNNGQLSSFTWDAPIKDISQDISRLHHREFTYHANETNEIKETLEFIFRGILEVRAQRGYEWTYGLTSPAINLIGLEQLMLAMYDDPDGLHALMAFLRDDHLQSLDWLESNGLLAPNNEDDYVGSGTVGYTDALPTNGCEPSNPGRVKDLWGLIESQETVGVSPGFFQEFVFPYQQAVAKRFGLCYYGCCEPIDGRWQVIKQLDNMRCVSISPWSNEELMAANIGSDYVYCRKPNPTQVSTPVWNEDAIRRDIEHTVSITKGMNVEIVLKDVHTLNNEPWRLGRWVDIARDVIDAVYR